jgi:hypothetical protein
MSAQPEDDTHELIHLGGETAVVVPLGEYRTLKVLRDAATAADIEDAAAVAAYLADKDGIRARGVTDDELDAVLDRMDAGRA